MDPDTASLWGLNPDPSIPTLVADPDVAGYGVSPGTFLHTTRPLLTTSQGSSVFLV